MAALMPQGKQQYFTAGGIPLVGGKVYTYAAGTTTPLATYTTAAAGTPNANPVILDSRGEASIFFSAANYKIVVKDSLDSTIWTVDNLAGDAAATIVANLAASTGSSLVGHIASGTGAVATTVQAKLRESVSVKDFGAVGDGVTDDTAAIQAAVNYCFTAGKNLTSPVEKIYLISSPVTIPQHFNTDYRKIKVDFCGAKLKLASDISLFVSESWGSSLATIPSNGIDFGGFTITHSLGSVTTNSALLIQDWYQNCILHNITAADIGTVLHSKNNFYCYFENIFTQIGVTATKTGARFVFSESHNLNKLSRLQAGTAVTGYRFDGPVTAMQMTGISFEGQTKGVVFNSSVYDAVIENSYIEGVSDVVVTTATSVYGLTVRNNYVNFQNNAATYLIEYTPGPANNIHITDDNDFQDMPSIANIIKNREDVYGAGIVIDRFPQNAITTSNFIVDATKIGNNIKWNQNASNAYLNANVVNKYAIGNYSGQYTNGLNGGANGFDWIDTGANTLVLRTTIVNNFAQLVYVCITVAHSAGPTTIKGQFIGQTFYEYTGAGLVISTKLTYGTFGGYMQIDGGIFFNVLVTGCIGEIRLI